MEIISFIILITVGVALLAGAAYYDYKKVPVVPGNGSIVQQILVAMKDMKQLHEDLKPTKKD